MASSDPINRLQLEINKLWAKTGKQSEIALQKVRQDDGSPHVEYQASGYVIIITERGIILEQISGLTLAKAARWFLFGMATGLAQSHELKNRKKPHIARQITNGLSDDGYSRWNWMAPCIETMYSISISLGDYAKAHYADILDNAPLEPYEKLNAKWDLKP